LNASSPLSGAFKLASQGESSGKKLSSVPVPQSALSITGHIQDDTDLNRIGITIDHASDTLQHGQCASVQAEKARSSRDVYLGCDTL
jgi:hypothetical protein